MELAWWADGTLASKKPGQGNNQVAMIPSCQARYGKVAVQLTSLQLETLNTTYTHVHTYLGTSDQQPTTSHTVVHRQCTMPSGSANTAEPTAAAVPSEGKPSTGITTYGATTSHPPLNQHRNMTPCRWSCSKTGLVLSGLILVMVIRSAGFVGNMYYMTQHQGAHTASIAGLNDT